MNTVAFISPFSNDPFAMVCQAYKNLYNKPFVAFYDQHEDDNRKDEYGFTHFVDGEIPKIVVFAEYPVNICVETFAHELAHVAVGVGHEHDEVWEAAFDAIFKEYNRLGEELYGHEEGAEDG